MSDAEEITLERIETARRCLRAAELRAEALTYRDIARDIGAGSPKDAQDACNTAWKMLDALGDGNGVPSRLLSLTVAQVGDMAALIRRKIAAQQEWQQRWDAMTDEQRQETTEKAKAALPPHVRDLLWPGDEAGDGRPVR